MGFDVRAEALTRLSEVLQQLLERRNSEIEKRKAKNGMLWCRGEAASCSRILSVARGRLLAPMQTNELRSAAGLGLPQAGAWGLGRF